MYIYITFLKSTKSLIAQLVFLHISSEDIQCSNPSTPNYFHSMLIANSNYNDILKSELKVMLYASWLSLSWITFALSFQLGECSQPAKIDLIPNPPSWVDLQGLLDCEISFTVSRVGFGS